MSPKPPRLSPSQERLSVRRKAVTIVAAFQCADGILMCADTEETISDVAECECDELRCFRICKNGFALCGGAGYSSLIELVWHRLHQDMFNHVYDWSEIEGVLNRHAMEIFDEHIGPYAHFPEHLIPTLEMLIAVQMEGKIQLYKWELNFVRPIPSGTHDAIGKGVLQASALIRENRFSFPSYDMLYFAVRIMDRVKKTVPGCGGKTEI